MNASHSIQRSAFPSGRANLPARAGLGLKVQHSGMVLESLPDVGFFEVHAENYLVDGGPFHRHLTRIRESYPLSLHGVGLSIGGESLDTAHLERIAALVNRYQPQSFSEHLAWSSHGGVFYNDLLPLAYTGETLQRVCNHIDRVQTRLRRRMLLENPATYIEFVDSTYTEAEFITEVTRRTACGLLLDVNNVYVSCANHRRDMHRYLRTLPLDRIGEIHLAGFSTEIDGLGNTLHIDTHGSEVADAVWQLYEYALGLAGPQPTLIEWDNAVPALDVLLAQARQADAMLRAPSAKLACA